MKALGYEEGRSIQLDFRHLADEADEDEVSATPSEFIRARGDLGFDLNTARVLGLTVPESLLLRADRVIGR